MFTPAVESASDSLIVLEGAESVIDIVMLGMFKAMLDMSIKTLEAIATEILTLLVVKVFSVQNNGDIAKRRGQKKDVRVGKLLLDEHHKEMGIRYTPRLVDFDNGPCMRI